MSGQRQGELLPGMLREPELHEKRRFVAPERMGKGEQVLPDFGLLNGNSFKIGKLHAAANARQGEYLRTVYHPQSSSADCSALTPPEDRMQQRTDRATLREPRGVQYLQYFWAGRRDWAG